MEDDAAYVDSTESENELDTPIVEDNVRLEDVSDSDDDANFLPTANNVADAQSRAGLLFRSAVQQVLRRARRSFATSPSSPSSRYSADGTASDHSYLGDVRTIRSVGGVTLRPTEESTNPTDDSDDDDDNIPIIDDSIIIPILPLPLVLLPYETLPLRLYQTSQIAHVKSAVERARLGETKATLLGVVTSGIDADIGTLANIVSIVEDNGDDNNNDEVIVMATGVGRFRLLSIDDGLSGRSGAMRFERVHYLSSSVMTTALRPNAAVLMATPPRLLMRYGASELSYENENEKRSDEHVCVV